MLAAEQLRMQWLARSGRIVWNGTRGEYGYVRGVKVTRDGVCSVNVAYNDGDKTWVQVDQLEDTNGLIRFRDKEDSH